MAWPEEIADGLPAPRDDEPASLRQDIVDELSDHLSSALNRELHRGHEQMKAKQNVIERFGNPARIAYRLWFDAMQEKIMTQRITLAAAIVIAVACLFVAGIAWQMSQQNRATNLAILDKLGALAMQQEQHKSLDWNPVKFKFVTGDENGPPIEGLKVSLACMAGFGEGAAPPQMPTLDDVTGADGVIDFGSVRYGTYQLNMTCPWPEAGSGTVTVRPGKAISRTIVCPSKPESADFTFEIDWPEDLKPLKLWAGGQVFFERVRSPDPQVSWGNVGFAVALAPYALMTDTGEVIDCGNHRPYSNNVRSQQFDVIVDQRKAERALHGFARRAFLTHLQIMEKPRAAADGKLELPEHALATYNFKPPGWDAKMSGASFGGSGSFPGGAQNGSWGVLPAEPTSPKPNAANASQTIAEFPRLNPQPNQANHWKIELPEELIAYLRTKIRRL